jgi:hypothetical protein
LGSALILDFTSGRFAQVLDWAGFLAIFEAWGIVTKIELRQNGVFLVFEEAKLPYFTGITGSFGSELLPGLGMVFDDDWDLAAR